MPGRNFALHDYERYLLQVGEAAYIDCTRRCDPARIKAVWENLGALYRTYGAPWIVQLWTKNPKGVLKHGGPLLRKLRESGTTLTCQLTVTGLAGTKFEPLVPRQAFQAARKLIELLGGPEHVTWRFDPIVPGLENLKRFTQLAPQAVELGIRRLVINFVCEPGKYRRADKRLASLLPYWREGLPGIPTDWREETARQILSLADPLGFSVHVCAESAHLRSTVPGLGRAACGDFDWFCSLSGKRPPAVRGRGSRPGCGCAPYFDVGSYGFWRKCHRCAYCYAG